MSERSPEINDGTRADLPDNVGSHLVIGILFGLVMVSNPRRTLGAMRAHGIGSIAEGYKKFYKGVRPDISYPRKLS